MAADRGFTLLELVVVICLIGVLSAVALDRLLELRVEAERAALEETLGRLNSAVAMELVSLLASNRDEQIEQLKDANPMEYLVQPPSSYAGEFEHPDPAAIEAGHWYFDRGERLLVYRVRYGDYFDVPLPGPPRARFRTQLAFDDRNANGRFDAGFDGVGGVRLAPAEAYRWRPVRDRSGRGKTDE